MIMEQITISDKIDQIIDLILPQIIRKKNPEFTKFIQMENFGKYKTDGVLLEKLMKSERAKLI